MSSDTWILYGLFDTPCPTPSLSPYESKLGGYPDFFDTCLLTSAPSCQVCHSSLVLVVQIYCPLEDSPFHRLLHVYSCTEKSCWNSSKSWLVLRSQSFDPSYASHVQEKKEPRVDAKYVAMAEDWCSGADDWFSDETLGCSGEDNARKTSHDLPCKNESHDVPKSCDQQSTTEPCDQPSTTESCDQPSTAEPCDQPSTTESCDQPSIAKSCDLPSVQDSSTSQCGRGSVVDQTSAACDADKESTHLHPYVGPAYPAGYIRVTHYSDGGQYDINKAKAVELLEHYSVENPDCLLLRTHQTSNNRLSSIHGKVSSRGGAKENNKGRDLKAVTKNISGEAYEKSVAKHGDVAFVKFQKELDKCPRQLLRYHWKGEAVHMTQTDIAKCVEACPVCGADRVYECQLMPQAVYYLQRLHSQCHGEDPEGMSRPNNTVEFGTVFIYTCSESCWNHHTVADAQSTNCTTTGRGSEDNHLARFKQELIFVQTE